MPPKQSAIEAGESTGRRSVVSRSTSLREAHALQKLIEQRFPIVYSHDNAREARIWAYVARCMALLSGMVVLLEATEDDSAGVLYRTLVETWLLGVYLIHNGSDALDELEADLARRADKINRVLDRPVTNMGSELRVEEVAKRLRGLVDDDFFQRVYDIHYRIGSFHDSHGHLGSLVGNLMADDRSITITYRRADPDHLAAPDLFLAMAVSLCTGIANRSQQETGLPLQGLDEFITRWWSYGGAADRTKK